MRSTTAIAYRLLIATVLYTGLRISEALGLVWDDVDLEEGVIHVRAQLSRAHLHRPARRVAPKTSAAVREVPLVAQLARLLAADRATSQFAGRGDWVFATSHGTPHGQRNVMARGLTPAADRAGLNDGTWPPLRFHDLRHTFASHLIVDLERDVTLVSRLMGHARVTITLDVYAPVRRGSPSPRAARVHGGEPVRGTAGGRDAVRGRHGHATDALSCAAPDSPGKAAWTVLAPTYGERAMTLQAFDEFRRLDPEPAHAEEGSFAFLNRAATPCWGRVREFIEEAFAEYPAAHAADLRARFRDRRFRSSCRSLPHMSIGTGGCLSVADKTAAEVLALDRAWPGPGKPFELAA